jgi:hypothetical protein
MQTGTTPAKDNLPVFGTLSIGVDSLSIARDHSPTKIKTRPNEQQESNDGSTDEPQIAAASTETRKILKIDVSRKSLTIFHRLLMSSDIPSGPTKWVDLVAALIEAGCSMIQGSGSAVTFINELNRQGSVSVHKPHPESQFHPIQLRKVGRNINRRLGWDEHTFVERSKGREGSKRSA